MSLTVLSTHPHSVGGNFSTQCEATVSHHVNTPVSVEFIWFRGDEQLSESFDSRVDIAETVSVGDLVFRSFMTISDLSIRTDSNVNYSCQASVRPIPISQFIINSDTALSNTELLEVLGEIN